VFVTELGPKRLQVIRELVPHAKMIAYIVNLSTETGPPQLRAMQAAAEAMGQQLLVLSAATEKQVNEAFTTLVERKADAIVYSLVCSFKS
jgi:putative ABC transport system substrate-binding protein